MLRRLGIAVASLCVGVPFHTTLAGPKWDISDTAYIQLGMLGQVHGSFTEDAPDEDDLYLRRARLILSGQVADGVKFFMETDNDNAGRNGTTDVETDIQDAFVEQRLYGSHYLQGGLILLPFSFENASSAGSLLGLDYNLETLKFAETFAWRDYGAVARGDFGKRVAYRVGGFDGYDDSAGTKNPDADIRGTGHVAVNLIGETENGWFFTQERLADKPYLAVGAGVDYQENATRIVPEEGEPEVVTDNRAWVVDFQSGFPVGLLAATLNGGWYVWDNATFNGDTAFIETGLRFNRLQAVAKLSVQDADGASDVTDGTVGFYHFPHLHNARAGVEYRWGDSSDQVLVGFQVAL